MFEILKCGCNVQSWWKLGPNIQQQQLFTPVLALLLNRKGFTGQTCVQTTGCVKFSDFDNWALKATAASFQVLHPPIVLRQQHHHHQRSHQPIVTHSLHQFQMKNTFLNLMKSTRSRYCLFLLDLCTKRTKRILDPKLKRNLCERIIYISAILEWPPHTFTPWDENLRIQRKGFFWEIFS